LRGVDRVRLPIHVGVFFEPEGKEGDEEFGLENEELGLDVEEKGRCPLTQHAENDRLEEGDGPRI